MSLKAFYEYGQKIRESKKPKNPITRAKRLCILYQGRTDYKYVEKLFKLIFPFLIHILSSKKYRQGFSVEHSISEAYILLEKVMRQFDYHKGVYFVSYFDMRLRGHLGNIKAKQKNDLHQTDQTKTNYEEYLARQEYPICDRKNP